MVELDQCNVAFLLEVRIQIFVCSADVQIFYCVHRMLYFQVFVKVSQFVKLLLEDVQPYHLFVLILFRTP